METVKTMHLNYKYYKVALSYQQFILVSDQIYMPLCLCVCVSVYLSVSLCVCVCVCVLYAKHSFKIYLVYCLLYCTCTVSIPDCGYLSTHSASIRYKHTNTISFFNSLEHPQSEQIKNHQKFTSPSEQVIHFQRATSSRRIK